MQVQNTLNQLRAQNAKAKLNQGANFKQMLDESLNENFKNIKNDDFSALSKKLQKQLKDDERLFKSFDFMQIMNELIYGNPSQSQKTKLLQKAEQIANSIS